MSARRMDIDWGLFDMNMTGRSCEREIDVVGPARKALEEEKDRKRWGVLYDAYTIVCTD